MNPATMTGHLGKLRLFLGGCGIMRAGCPTHEEHEMRFLGFMQADRVPDATMIGSFREEFGKGAGGTRVWADDKRDAGRMKMRRIGIKRIRSGIGLLNLVYNRVRYEQIVQLQLASSP